MKRDKEIVDCKSIKRYNIFKEHNRLYEIEVTGKLTRMSRDLPGTNLQAIHERKAVDV